MHHPECQSAYLVFSALIFETTLYLSFNMRFRSTLNSKSVNRPSGKMMRNGDQDNAWRELRDKYIFHVEKGTHWLEVLSLLTENPWYQAQLFRCAHLVVSSGGAPREWADDLQQEAFILLARRLRKSIDLGYDVDRPVDQFVGWLRTIIFRQCHEALRSMRRHHHRGQELKDGQGDTRESLDAHIDVNAALNNLNEPERTVLVLYAKGYSIADTADQLKLTYWQVQYARSCGFERLKLHLGAGY